jgi:hypothetical protein
MAAHLENSSRSRGKTGTEISHERLRSDAHSMDESDNSPIRTVVPTHR